MFARKGFFVLTALAAAAFALVIVFAGSVNALTAVSACGTLSGAGEYYALNKSINASGTCITVAADNVTLDCAYYGRQYNLTGALAGNSFGVYINGRTNVTVKNCLITSFDTGVYLRSSFGNSLENNVVTGNGDAGFFVRSSWGNSFFNNAVNENSAGFDLEEGADYNVFSNDQVTSSKNDAYGIVFYYPSTGNVFSNVSVQTRGSRAYPVYVDDDVNFSFADSFLAAYYPGTPDFYADGRGTPVFGSWNFTNVTFNKRGTVIERKGALSVYWYVEGRVTDAGGNPLSDALVAGSDVDGYGVFDAFTDSSGRIPRQTVLEYYQNESGVYNETPHSFNAYLAGYTTNNSRAVVSSNLVAENGNGIESGGGIGSGNGALSFVLTPVPAFAGGSTEIVVANLTPKGGSPVNCSEESVKAVGAVRAVKGECGLVYWRELHVYNAAGTEVAPGSPDEAGYSTVTLVVRNDLNQTVYNVLVTEVIPDSVASDPSLIYGFSKTPVSVRKGSVVVTWLFENVQPGEVKNVTYRVAKQTNKESSKDFPAPKVVAAAVGGGSVATPKPSVGASVSPKPSASARSKAGSSGSGSTAGGSGGYFAPTVKPAGGDIIFEFQGASFGRMTGAALVLIVIACAFVYWYYNKRESRE